MGFSDAFFQLAGPRWKLAKAIALVESNLNPWAVGDGGEARGLWQLHAKFAEDYSYADMDYWAGVLLRGDPWVAILIMKRFLEVKAELGDADVIGTFHYGATGWKEYADDPDKYVSEVLALLARL